MHIVRFLKQIDVWDAFIARLWVLQRYNTHDLIKAANKLSEMLDLSKHLGYNNPFAQIGSLCNEHI